MSGLLKTNIDIMNNVKEYFDKVKTSKFTAKGGYVRLIFHEYETYDIVIYSTNKEMLVEIKWGCIPIYGGDFCEPVIFQYISGKTFNNFSNTQKDEYIKITTEYLIGLVEYAYFCTAPMFEDYGYLLEFDWNRFFQSFDCKWQNKQNSAYIINAFITYAVSFDDKDKLKKYIVALQNISELEKQLRKHSDEIDDNISCKDFDLRGLLTSDIQKYFNDFYIM